MQNYVVFKFFFMLFYDFYDKYFINFIFLTNIFRNTSRETHPFFYEFICSLMLGNHLIVGFILLCCIW